MCHFLGYFQPLIDKAVDRCVVFCVRPPMCIRRPLTHPPDPAATPPHLPPFIHIYHFPALVSKSIVSALVSGCTKETIFLGSRPSRFVSDGDILPPGPLLLKVLRKAGRSAATAT